MNLLELRLRQFRSYESAEFRFEPGAIHILQGDNAQGKTNVIEAISYLSNLRSFRTRNIREMSMHGTSGFSIDAVCENGGIREDLRIFYADGKKKLFRYGNSVPSFSQFVGTLNAVLFSPDDMMFFTGAPAQRRRFLDAELVKLSTAYTASLSAFQKILKERNALLKRRSPDRNLLDTYTSRLIDLQCVIIRQREKFTASLNQKLADLYPVFSRGQEKLEIRYRTLAAPGPDLKTRLAKIYRDSLERDLRMQTTTTGIHKDDLVFLLDGYSMPAASSQGQKRSALLALKLALCEIIREKSGQYPVFLLDDVFSELDPVRRQKLIDLLPEGMQVCITAAEPVKADFGGRNVVIHHIIKERKLDRHEPH